VRAYEGTLINLNVAEDIRTQVGGNVDPTEVYFDEGGIITTDRPFPSFGQMPT